MDARTVLALWADDLDLDLTHGNAAELFDLFKKHGYQIIHRDENHGPTLERAAQRGDAWDSPQALLLAAGEMTVQEIRTARAVARGISAAIRAMGEKNDG